MPKYPLKIVIRTVDLNKITFSTIPYAPLLQKNDLYVLLNDIPFNDYDIFDASTDLGKTYCLTPKKPFNYTDALYIQVIKPCYESYRCKICFSMLLSAGAAKTNFIIPNAVQGSYYIEIADVNGIPINLSSSIFVVSKPIDIARSSISSCKKIYMCGEYIYLSIKLVNIDGDPVPDGIYEVEIIKIEN